MRLYSVRVISRRYLRVYGSNVASLTYLRNHSSIAINQTGVSIPLVRAIEVLVASSDYAADRLCKIFTKKRTYMDASLLRKLIVEFIGTFFLVYVVGCVPLQEHALLGPL